MRWRLQQNLIRLIRAAGFGCGFGCCTDAAVVMRLLLLVIGCSVARGHRLLSLLLWRYSAAAVAPIADAAAFAGVVQAFARSIGTSLSCVGC